MFNTGGKNNLSKTWEKPCKNMIKNFEGVGKSLDKIIGHIDAITFSVSLDKKKADFTALKSAFQSYKALFDLFGKAAGSTSAQPNPTQLMADINVLFTALNAIA